MRINQNEIVLPQAIRSGCFCVLIGCVAANAFAKSPTWAKFQNGGNSSLAVANLPTEWTPDSNIAWTADIQGYGQSTPVVFDERIVVSSTSGDHNEAYHLTAFAIDSGKRLWQLDFDNPTPTQTNSSTSRAAPTAVADKDGFIAFFEGGIVVATTADGDVRWQKNLVEMYGSVARRHGLSASLEQDDSLVFVWIERAEEPYVLAFDKKTGDEVWKAPGIGARSWASPRLVTVASDPHLVCSASGKIVGFNPATGKRLWEFKSISSNKYCTPIPVADGKFLIGASDGRGEIGSGTVAESTGVIEVIKNADEQFSVKFKWHARKATSAFGSPVVAGDTAAIVNRAGVLYRLNLENGDRVATDRIKAGELWATPIVAGDLLYLFGSKGTTSVVSLADGKEISSNRCWEQAGKDSSEYQGNVLYAAAAVPPYLILRRGDKLFAIMTEN